MPVSYDLGTASGKVVIDYDGRGVDQAGKGIDGLGKHSDNINKRLAGTQQVLDKTGNSALIAGGVIAGGFALALKTSADFESQMSAVQAVSGATSEQMKLVSAAALRIGKDTTFSASEAGSAMEELVKAGISVKDVLGGAADATVALAAAGGVDLPTAATLAANAMNQFKLGAKDLVKVTDTIAGAANASAIDVGQFSYSLAQVGAVAHLAGLSFDDTAVAIAEMGNAGIVGSDAGTSLKSMLMRLQPQTKQTADLMEQLGLITMDASKATEFLRSKGIKPLSKDSDVLIGQLKDYAMKITGVKSFNTEAQATFRKLAYETGSLNNQFYDQQGNLKSLSEIQQVLQTSLKGMSKEQKQAALQTLFGSDAIRGAAILAENGAAGYDKLAASMSKVSAADVAKTRMDNLKGSIEQLKGSFETLMITIGTKLVPVFRDLVDKLTEGINWFLALSDSMQAAIVGGAALAGGLLVAYGVLAKVASAAISMREAILLMTGAETISAGVTAGWNRILKLVNSSLLTNEALSYRTKIAILASAAATKIATAAQLIFNTVMKLNPIVLIISLIAGLVAALITLAGGWDEVLAAVKPAFDAMKSAFAPLLPQVQALGKMFADVLGTALQVVMGLLLTLAKAILPVIVQLLGILAPIIQIIGEVLAAILGPALAIVGALFEALGPLITALVALLMPLIKIILAVLTPVLDGIVWVLQKVADALTFAADAFSSWLSDVTGPVTESGAVMNWFGDVVDNVWSFIQTVVGAVVDWFNTSVLPVVTNVINGIVAAFNFLKDTATNVWNGMLAVITPVVAFFMNYVYPVIKAAIDLVVAVFNFLGATIAFVWNTIIAIVTPIVDFFMTYVAPVIQAAIGLVVAVFNFLWQTIQFVWGAIVAVVTVAVDFFMTYVWPVINAAIDLVVAVFQFLWATAQAIWNGIVAVVTAAVDFFMQYVYPVIKAAIDLVVRIFTFLGATVKAIWDRIVAVVTVVVNQVVNTIKAVWGTIVAVVTSIFGPVFNFISTTFNKIKSVISDIVNNVVNTIKVVWGNIVGVVKPIFEKVYDTIHEPLQKALDFIGGIKDKIIGFFSGAVNWLKDAGKNIMDGLVGGIKNGLSFLTDTLKNVTNLIPKTKGPPAKDKILLTPAGSSIMQGLIAGLRSQFPELTKTLGGISAMIPDSINSKVDTTLMANGIDGAAKTEEFNYYAAPGANQLSGAEEFYQAVRRSKVVVPGWASK